MKLLLVAEDDDLRRFLREELQRQVSLRLPGQLVEIAEAGDFQGALDRLRGVSVILTAEKFPTGPRWWDWEANWISLAGLCADRLKIGLVLLVGDEAVRARARSLGYAAFANPDQVSEAIGAVVAALVGVASVDTELKFTD